MKDPFVSAPFKKCPRCDKEALGVLNIGETFYSLRCAECGYPRGTKDNMTFFLPKLNKTIIYLDQFMLSNMVKSLIPDFSKDIPPFYIEAFKKLDRLSKLQLIICPDSDFHQNESELSKHAKELKRVYELLSHGVSFKVHSEILRLQVLEHLRRWIKGDISPETKLSLNDVTFGKVNAWQDRIQITIAHQDDPQRAIELKEMKLGAHKELQPALEHWKEQKDKGFDYFYGNELSHWGPNFSGSYDKWQKEVAALMKGESNEYLKGIPTSFAQISLHILEEFHKSGLKGQELLDNYHKFVSADSLENVPYIRICSMTLAKLGLKVSQGLKPENVKSSFLSDAMMMATVLPFCDAIFTEKQLANFFNESPLKQCLFEMPKIFSLNSQDKFLEYLDQLEKEASSAHLQLVEKVYGKDWGTPYVGVLKVDTDKD